MLKKLLKNTVREIVEEIKADEKFEKAVGSLYGVDVYNACEEIEKAKEKTKPCTGCGGMFQEDKMKVVKQHGWFINPESFFYCSNCKPNYDRIDRANGIRYFKEVEVDEKGNILPTKRYIKIPKDFYKPFKSTK